MSYIIIQKLISQNRSYSPLKAIGSVVHETATPGASDEAEQNYFNTGNRHASAHAFVDCDSITQCIPWNERAYHAGPTANGELIGIELCHYDDVARFNEVWKRAVWLFAYLHVNVLNQAKINVNTLMSHAEVSERWHETDHQDPISYFEQFDKTVDMFRQEVQQEINAMLGKDVSDMKLIVTYLGDADLFGAVMVSQKFQCPLMKKEDYIASGLKAEQVIEIGGKINSTRFTTFKDAAALV